MGYSSATNLYASRVYAENPLALWTLDDDVSFVSSISASNQNIENWNIFNGTASAATDISNVTQIPFFEKTIGGIGKNSGSNYVVYLMPNDGIDTRDLDQSKKTICINAYIWSNTNLVKNYQIGFKYSYEQYWDEVYDKTWQDIKDENTWFNLRYYSEIAQDGIFYDTSTLGYIEPEATSDRWQKITHTFEYEPGTTIYPYIEVEFEEGGSTSDYGIYCNALSVGQWSEKFHTDSTGIFPTPLSSSVAFYQLLPQTSSSVTINQISLDSYGIKKQDNGYYILENNKMLAINNGLPMVFGAANITNVYYPETQNMPSIVIPGKGFLNQRGKYKRLTAEFWLRIYNGSQTLKKIFGPLSSKDGLYVEEEFLTLRVGKYQKSYFIGKWYRPMLVDMVYTPENISILINGISVISLDLIIDEIDLPKVEFDWLGFYAHSETQPFELDCVAIYPYDVSEQLAKRRFVYGQGVEYPDIVSSKFGGDSAFIDYQFSKYSSEFLFPDRAKWNSGFYSNLETDLQELTFTDYQLPQLQFFGKSTQEIDLSQYENTWDSGLEFTSWFTWTFEKIWEQLLIDTSLNFFTDNFRIQETDPYAFISMAPNQIFINEGVYPNLFFNSINILTSPINSIFGVFGNSASVTNDSQILFKIRDRLTENYFEVYKNSSSVVYNYNNGSNNILSIKNVSANSHFIAGIDINEITKRYKRIVENFFTIPENLSLSLGGYENNIFKGKIYSFTFNNELFTDKDLNEYIDSFGFFHGNVSASSSILNNDEYIMKYVGNYSLLPKITAKTVDLEIGSSGYWEGLVPLSVLGKNIVKSNGENFYDLDMIQFNIDFPSPVITSQSPPAEENDTRLKSYITLQDFRRAGSIPYTNWISASNITTSRLIDFDNTIDVLQSKYEVVDGTVIIPPKELIDFKNYYLGIHLEMSTRSISSMPIKLQRMSFASLAFDETSFYPIGTKTGKEIYPFTRYGSSYYPKEKNPILIYKGSTPYLYLTDDSGICVLDYNSNATARGITIPMNQNKSPTFELGGLQMWMFYKEKGLFEDLQIIGMINTINEKIQIIIDPEDNGKRGKLYLYDLNSNQEFTSVKFYQNGNLVTNPYIEPLQWTSIIMSFGNKISLSSQSGQFEIYHGMVFNNIAFFEQLTDVFALTKDFNLWTFFSDEIWLNSASVSWTEILGEKTIEAFSLNGIEIFNTYLGLSKVVIKDSSQLMIDAEKVEQFMNVSWLQFSGRPV